MGKVVKATLAWQENFNGTLGGNSPHTIVCTDLHEPRTSCFVSVGDGAIDWTLDVVFEELHPMLDQPLKGGKKLTATVSPGQPWVLLTIPFGALSRYQITLTAHPGQYNTNVSGVWAGTRSEETIPTMDHDGKQIVVQNPATEGSKTRFLGAGGVPSDSDRVTICHRFAGPEVYEADLQWPFPVEINDIEAHWSPPAGHPNPAWNIEDKFSSWFIFPATVVAEAPGNDGNVNVIGGKITPNLLGTGSHTLDLANAVPVPNPLGKGYYDVDLRTGAVTMSQTPGGADYDLYDFEMDNANASAAIDYVDLGHPGGWMETNPYKTEWVHPKWKVHIKVEKVTPGVGTFGGWLMGFRL